MQQVVKFHELRGTENERAFQIFSVFFINKTREIFPWFQFSFITCVLLRDNHQLSSILGIRMIKQISAVTGSLAVK